MEKVAIIGSGMGAQLIAAHLDDWDSYGIRYEYEFFDDYSEKKLEHIPDDYKIIISVSQMGFRRRAFKMFDKNRFLSVNRSDYGDCEINMGISNLIFPNVHFDLFHQIGDNNVISNGTIINHHCKIGSGNLFGPGCLLSGSVTIGDNCTIGSGVIFEPRVVIGDNVMIASGTVITRSIPSNKRIIAGVQAANISVYQGGRVIRNNKTS